MSVYRSRHRCRRPSLWRQLVAQFRHVMEVGW